MMQTIHGISDSLVPLRVHDKGGIARSVQVVLTSSEEDKSALLVCTYDFLLNIFLFFFVSCTLAKSVLLILAAPAKLYKKKKIGIVMYHPKFQSVHVYPNHISKLKKMILLM